MNRSRIAGVMSASTALALLTTVPASAHGSESAATPLRYGPAATQRIVFKDLVVKELDALQARAAALHARTAAIPASTVLTGRQRAKAVREYKHATRLSAALGKLSGLTPAQADQVDAIQAQLDIAAAQLMAVLANRPAIALARVKVVHAERVVRAADTTAASGTVDPRDGRCDHDHDGFRSASTYHDGRDSSRGTRHGRHHRHLR